MGGWRDTEGRTRNARARQERDAKLRRALDRVKRQPLSLLRSLLLGVLVLVVALAVALS
jgi:hypothetical protein